jgi:hypothetical protein
VTCCAHFREHQAQAKEDHGDGLFEQLSDGSWAIYGCCGGGCYVVQDMHHCPFCGIRLQEERLV